MKRQVSSLRFRSRSEHSLDSKGRLNIPSRFREVLREVYSETIMITNWKQCLKAYPLDVWEDLEEKIVNEGRRQPEISGFVRYVISGVVECTPDKQGRILLPPSLRGQFGIEKEVVLNGMLDHFEIWDKEAWLEETRATRENFQDFEPSLSALGIL